MGGIKLGILFAKLKEIIMFDQTKKGKYHEKKNGDFGINRIGFFSQL